jgi:hypothetical protein
MTISTIVVWNPVPTQEQNDTIDSKALAMASEGKTDNVPHSVTDGDVRTVTRTWNTTADAEEWVTFLEPFNPQSITIT